MAAIKVQSVIDENPLRGINFLILATCMLIMFIDGLDIFLVGKIAPAIAAGLGETPAAMTLVFLCQQIGLALGAFLATPLADRFGRRRMLMLASMAFGLLTFATSFAGSIEQMALLRGCAGLFLAGGLPMAVALLSELTPRARRGTFIAMSFAAYSAGGAAGGAIAAWVIDDHGWQSGFWIGGLLPLLSLPMILLIPESPQYLAAKSASDARIGAILRRLRPGLTVSPGDSYLVDDGSRSADRASLLDIFRDGRARMTWIIWLACFFSMGNIALLAAWLPTFFQEMAGIPIQRFAVFAMIGFAGGLVGTVAMGWLLDRFRASRLIPGYYLGLSACIAALAFVPFEASLFVGVLLAMNFFQTGGQTGLNTLMTRVYPASMRSTGLGWAGGAGRIGGIIAPVAGGFAVASHLSLANTLLATAVMPLIVALLALLIRDDRRTG